MHSYTERLSITEQTITVKRPVRMANWKAAGCSDTMGELLLGVYPGK